MPEAVDEEKNPHHQKHSQDESRECQALKTSKERFNEIFTRRYERADRQGRGKDHSNRDVCSKSSAFL